MNCSQISGAQGMPGVCNARPTQDSTASILRELTAGLVAVSSQHEHRTLSDPATHLALLDAFAGNGALAAEMERRHRSLIAARRTLDEIVQQHSQRLERADFLRERVKELERARIRAGETAEIEANVGAAKSGAKLAAVLDRAAAALSEAEAGASASAQLARAEQALEEAAQIDARLRSIVSEAAEARAVAEDAARELAAYRERVEHDPARLEKMEDRLHLLRRLVRAHGGTEENALARLDEMRAELDLVDRHGDHRTAAEKSLADAEAAADEIASRLSAARSKAARKLGKEITAGLEALGMSGAAVEAALRPASEGAEVRGRKIAAAGAEAGS